MDEKKDYLAGVSTHLHRKVTKGGKPTKKSHETKVPGSKIGR